MKKTCLILFGVLFPLMTMAEKPELVYDVDLFFNFDNYESHSAYRESGTVFGVRLTPTIGVAYQDSVVGSHRLMAGVSYIQPFGSTWRDAKVLPTMYYHFSQHGFSSYVGFVPYDALMDHLPDYMMSDSMRFMYPNIQGALFQYADRHGSIEAFIDWRGMMSDTVREAFRIIGTGRGFLYRDSRHEAYMGGRAMLNHLSHSEKVLGVCDDITLQPMVGYRFVSGEKRVRKWEANAELGYLFSWQRDRRADYSALSHGLLAEAELRWWFLGLKETLYCGGNAMSLFPKYGILLNQGDPNYQSSLLSKTELYATLAEWRFMTLYAGWALVYTPGSTMSSQQLVTARFNLEKLMNYCSERK